MQELQDEIDLLEDKIIELEKKNSELIIEINKIRYNVESKQNRNGYVAVADYNSIYYRPDTHYDITYIEKKKAAIRTQIENIELLQARIQIETDQIQRNEYARTPYRNIEEHQHAINAAAIVTEHLQGELQTAQVTVNTEPNDLAFLDEL